MFILINHLRVLCLSTRRHHCFLNNLDLMSTISDINQFKSVFFVSQFENLTHLSEGKDKSF